MSSKEAPLLGYDIIGDVHGCADTLKALLNKLGYRPFGDGFRFENNTRRLIFVGDLIDRGRQIKETLRLVKACVEDSQAQVVLGNHEFNAIAYFTPVESGYLRPRNIRSQAQIQDTLDQLGSNEALISDYIPWFKTLPLFLDLPEFRVVHACWDQSLITRFQQRFPSGCVSDDVLAACVEGDSVVVQTINRLTCGLNLKCPVGVNIKGRDGFTRTSFRAKFWGDTSPKTYQDIVFQPDPLPALLSEREVSTADHEKLFYYSKDEKPLFIGHYWLKGQFELVASNIACLDYSAVSGGRLVAYQFHKGDKGLYADNFIAVDHKDSS